MATLQFSSDTYLDSGTRTSADQFQVSNGANFIVRTDTRWYAGAPAGFVGNIGINNSFSANTNANFLLDGRSVRWMAFDSGTGNVPAIGTSITQGGVTGYLLGVWTALNVTPSTVGSAMPTTGFLKFREVTGGSYAAGSLTGIGANASSPDVTGWIEVTALNSTAATFGPSSKLQVKGDWFYLDSTTGVAGQTIQSPTVGGGANTSISGVQIETAPGSGVFEWYPSVVANSTTGGWVTTAMGTDARNKFVQWVSGGAVRIGSDGTNNIGYVPAAGCKVRIPNVICRQFAAGAQNVNVLPSTSFASRTHMNVSSSGGIIEMDKCMSDWYQNLRQYNSCTITNSAFDGGFVFNTSKGPATITDSCVGASIAPSTITQCLDFSNTTYPVTLTRVTVILPANSTAQYPCKVTNCTNLTFESVKLFYPNNRSTACTALQISGITNSTFNNTYLVGGYAFLASCDTFTMTNTDYTDRMVGTTTSTAALSAFQVSASSGVTIDGVTCGFGGTYTGSHPYNQWILTSGVISKCKFRNFGSYTAPLDSGSVAANYPNAIMSMSALDTGSKYQRLYVTGTRGQSFSITTNSNCTFENIYSFSRSADSVTLNGSGNVVRQVYGFPFVSTSSNNNIGIHWMDSFVTATTGAISFTSNEIAPDEASLFTTSGTVRSNGSNQFYMQSTGDFIICEMPGFAKGVTGFANVAPVVSTSNGTVTMTYQIDKGAGYNGTFKALSAANLFAETGIDPSIGVRLKFKATANSGGTTWPGVKITTATTAVAQSSNLFPLDTNTLAFTGLVAGSEVRVYAGTDPSSAVEIGGTESTAGSTFSFTHSSGGQDGYIMILAMGYQPVYLPYTFKSVDDSILIQPVIDRNYYNPS